MRRALWLMLAVIGVHAAEVDAQAIPIDERSSEAAVAIVEWLARSIKDSDPSRTLVFSTLTNGATVVRKPHGWAISTAPKNAIPFTEAAFGEIGARVGIEIRLCNELIGESLCGIEQPWYWILLSAPTRDGERVLFEVEEREISYPPPGVDGVGSRESTSRIVVVRREGDRWRVARTIE